MRKKRREQKGRENERARERERGRKGKERDPRCVMGRETRHNLSQCIYSRHDVQYYNSADDWRIHNSNAHRSEFITCARARACERDRVYMGERERKGGEGKEERIRIHYPVSDLIRVSASRVCAHPLCYMAQPRLPSSLCR